MCDHSNRPKSRPDDLVELDGVGLVPCQEAFGSGSESVATALILRDTATQDGGESARSPSHRHEWWKDKGLRFAGLVLLAVAFLAIRYLVDLVPPHSSHEATWIELALAAVGFLGASLGGILVTLGAHIFDKVEISERWRTRD